MHHTTTTEGTGIMCGWNCGDERPGHGHFAVIVRERGGKLIGRLCPDGTATNRRIFAAVLSQARAESIAAEITAGGEFKAHARKF